MRLLSVTFTLVFALSLSIPTIASASSVDSTVAKKNLNVSLNEYDYYNYIRTTDINTLLDEGIDYSTIQEVKSDKLEKELLKRSKLSTAELMDTYGYSLQQAEVLQSYDGQTIDENFINDQPIVMGIFANVTCSFSPYVASTTYMAVVVAFEWSNSPLLDNVDDVIGIRWQGTNTSGQPINLALSKPASSVSLKYYTRLGAYAKTLYPSVETDDPYGHAYSKFNLYWTDNNTQAFLKRGSFKIYLGVTGTDKIKEAAFVFGYGHSIITMSPSISLPASFGIGFSTGVESMCTKAIRYSSSGVITAY